MSTETETHTTAPKILEVMPQGTELSLMPIMLNKAQVCEILGISEPTFQRMIKDNKIKSIKLGARGRRVMRDDLVAFINSRGAA